jgi:hypothetical protein
MGRAVGVLRLLRLFGDAITADADIRRDARVCFLAQAPVIAFWIAIALRFVALEPGRTELIWTRQFTMPGDGTGQPVMARP